MSRSQPLSQSRTHQHPHPHQHPHLHQYPHLHQHPQTTISDLKAVCADTMTTAISTYDELNRQSDVLSDANYQLDDMRYDMKIAEQSLNNIDSWWHRIVNYFTPDPDPVAYKAIRTKSNSTNNHNITRQLGKTTNENNPKSCADTNTSSEDLDQLLTMVSDMKTISIQIGEQIDKSADLVADIGHKTQRADSKIGAFIAKEKSIMKQ